MGMPISVLLFNIMQFPKYVDVDEKEWKYVNSHHVGNMTLIQYSQNVLKLDAIFKVYEHGNCELTVMSPWSGKKVVKKFDNFSTNMIGKMISECIDVNSDLQMIAELYVNEIVNLKPLISDFIETGDVFNQFNTLLNSEIRYSTNSKSLQQLMKILKDVLLGSHDKDTMKEMISSQLLHMGEDELKESNNIHLFAKIVNRVIEHIQYELNSANPEVEETEQDVFGKFAFADEKYGYEQSPEHDVQQERILYQKILDFMNGDIARLTSEDCNLMLNFIKEGKYTRIFMKPDTDVVYRGMSVKREWFNKHRSGEFTYSPKFKASSWTRDFDIAKRFAIVKNDDHPGNVAVVITTSVNGIDAIDCGNLLKGIYSIDSGPKGDGRIASWDHEKEIIVIGDATVNSVKIV